MDFKLAFIKFVLPVPGAPITSMPSPSLSPFIPIFNPVPGSVKTAYGCSEFSAVHTGTEFASIFPPNSSLEYTFLFLPVLTDQFI